MNNPSSRGRKRDGQGTSLAAIGDTMQTKDNTDRKRVTRTARYADLVRYLDDATEQPFRDYIAREHAAMLDRIDGWRPHAMLAACRWAATAARTVGCADLFDGLVEVLELATGPVSMSECVLTISAADAARAELLARLATRRRVRATAGAARAVVLIDLVLAAVRAGALAGLDSAARARGLGGVHA